MSHGIERVIVLVMDSAGCGSAPDASAYGDQGANTLGHIASALGGLPLPTLASLGLTKIVDLKVPTYSLLPVKGCYGILQEASAGKDTTTGHWEMMGVLLKKPFPLYPKGFPRSVILDLEKKFGRKTIGNKVASGTEIIKELGEEHVKSGCPIVYTSADSVLQIACHEEIIPLEELYRFCSLAREVMVGEHAVGRIIARPFVGKPGSFVRTSNRRDFSLLPSSPTVLDILKGHGQMVYGIGKIEDIFAAQGITEAVHSPGNAAGMDDTIKALRQQKKKGLIFINLVDFDMLYGHRNDPKGYAQALKTFDAWLPTLLEEMGKNDLLIITADHGNETTDVSTDHTRENVPLLVYGPRCRQGVNLGTRDSFADVGATVADLLDVPLPALGRSFADQLF